MKAEILNPLKWVSLVRITIVTVIVGIGIYFFGKQPLPFSTTPLWTLIALTYLLTAGYWICLKKESLLSFILWSSVVLDVLIISAIVHYTGGIESDFAFLYFFPIISASMFFFLRGGVGIATLCISVYAAILALGFHKIIPPVFQYDLEPDINILYLKLYLQATFFYLVATTSGYLSERFKHKREALEQAKLDTNAILQSMNSGLIVVDLKGNLLYKNKVADKILGQATEKSLDELTQKLPEFGKYLSKLLHEKFLGKLEEVKLGARTIGINTSRLQGKNGKKRGAIFVFQDLTEAKITERLATIGRFSSDLAHEVRNPVTAIQGSCELIKAGTTLNEKKRLLEIVLRESQNLNEVVTNFLSFTRDEPLKLEPIKVEKVIADAVKIAKEVFPHNEIPVKVIQSAPLGLKLDRDQMKTAFLNLITNAIQSMKREGELRIEIKHPGEKYKLFEEEHQVPQNLAVITFKDTGQGISEADLPQIFNPFFTTRKEGTGIGLSIVSRIVENHNGQIEVKSRVGEGTIFTIYLPYAS